MRAQPAGPDIVFGKETACFLPLRQRGHLLSMNIEKNRSFSERDQCTSPDGERDKSAFGGRPDGGRETAAGCTIPWNPLYLREHIPLYVGTAGIHS